MAIQAILLEDHPLYREGLKSFLRSRFPELQFVYEGDDFLAARQACHEDSPSIAIVDLHLGRDQSPSEIVGFFSSKSIPVLVISALNSFEAVKNAFSVGASGFICKDSSTEEMEKAIKSVLAGGQWIAPTLSRALTYKEPVANLLSAQELKASILYASGLKLEVVARRMGVAPSTIKQYIDRSKAKFRAAGTPVSTKTDLYKLLRNEGLVE
jgi:DNA-binding NarL/FixJ family response regulator